MITGAGRGLGHAFAEEAVKNGEKVIATVRKINDTDRNQEIRQDRRADQ